MGFTDKFKDLVKKGQDEAATHKDQVHKAVVKAEEAADRQTGGQYHDQILNAGHKADDYVDGLKASEETPPGQPRRGDGPPEPLR